MNRWIGSLVGVAVLGIPAWSFACSIACGDSTKISAGETGMPANTPSLFFDLDRASGVDSPITLIEVGGDDVPFAMEGCCQLTPDAPFQPNTTYLVGRNVDPDFGCETPLSLTFTTGDIEPFPESLGALAADATKKEGLSIDSADGCSDLMEFVYADVALDLSEDAQLWQGGLIIDTLVNGERFHKSSSYGTTYKPGESWMGYGKNRVFVICDERFPQYHEYGLEEGSHEIQMVGTIPGTEVRIESNTVTVNLYCNPPAPAEEESGCSAAGSAPFALSLLILGALRRRKRG